MKRLAAAILVALIATAGVSQAATRAPRAQHIVIGLDLSRSNPLIDNADWAQRVADRLAPLIEALPMRSQVTLRTFGSYDSSDNTLRIDKVISAQAKPDDIARLVRGIVAGVPKLVRDGTLKAQMKTNVIAFLENMAAVVDCEAMPTTVILATDGVEDSEYANLRQDDAVLPVPATAIFAGCEAMTMLGVGQNLGSPLATERIRSQWQAWALAAGFTTFEGLNDW